MRLVAWNCCRGPLAKKLAALEPLAADIAVVPECPELPASRGSTYWVGANARGGLGVIAKPPWRIAAATRRRDLPRWIHPLKVSGPEEFVLWAVWACNVGVDRYVEGIHRAVDGGKRLFGRGPNVMLGDFNSNSIWDHQHDPEMSHSGLVRKLDRLGLASSYHVHFDEKHGAESRPTFFEYRHAHRPYHIDYCFLPHAWARRIERVTVGAHAEWAKTSDHMPLVVDLPP